MSEGGESGDLGRMLKSSAQGLVREVAERLDIAGVKDALTEIETAGKRGRVDAEVVSATPLTDDQRQALESRLRARYGSDLPIAYRVDSAVLGGLVVRVGDRYIDGSVASRLSQLREKLVGARST